MAPVVSTVASIDGVTMTFGDTEVTDGLEGYASVVPYVIAGNRVFKMTAVADGTSYTASVTCSSGVETGETQVLEFDASQFEPSIELVWANADFEGMPFKINYPAIDNAGNSVKAQLAIKYIMNKLGLSVFSGDSVTVTD